MGMIRYTYGDLYVPGRRPSAPVACCGTEGRVSIAV